MYVSALINDNENSALVDTRAIHNFISSAIAMHLSLKLEKRRMIPQSGKCGC